MCRFPGLKRRQKKQMWDSLPKLRQNIPDHKKLLSSELRQKIPDHKNLFGFVVKVTDAKNLDHSKRKNAKPIAAVSYATRKQRATLSHKYSRESPSRMPWAPGSGRDAQRRAGAMRISPIDQLVCTYRGNFFATSRFPGRLSLFWPRADTPFA